MNLLLVSDESTVREAHQRIADQETELVRELTKRGVNVTVALLRGDPPLVAVLQERGCRVFPLGFRHYRDSPRAILRLIRLLRAHRFDVVVGREVIPAIIVGAAARAARTEALSEFVRFHTFGGLKLNSASRLASLLCDHTLAVSRSVAEHAAHLDRASKVRTAYLGRSPLRAVPSAEIDALRDALGIRSQAPVVTIVARLRHEKGIDLAIKAVEGVRREDRPPPELLIVGSGPEEARLRDLAENALRRRAHFVGHQDDVAPWLALADVVLIPSRKEAFGYSAVEAMSLGRPVVASDVGGLPEVIEDGVSGLLVPPDDPAAITEKLELLLVDRSFARRLGTSARSRYEEIFTLDVMIENWIRIWLEELRDRALSAPTGSRAS